MKLINIGFGSMVAAGRVLSMLAPDSAPIKRIVQEAKDRGMLIDASYGRATKTVILMDTDHVILSALTPDVLSARWLDKQANEGDRKACTKLSEINTMIADDQKYSMVENSIIDFFYDHLILITHHLTKALGFPQFFVLLTLILLVLKKW